MDELEEAELEVEALLLAVAEFVEGAEHGLEEASELFLAEEGGGAGGAALFFGGDLEELREGVGIQGVSPAILAMTHERR